MKIGKQPCKRCFHYFLKAFNLHWFQSNSCTATRSYLEAFQWIFYPVRNFFKGKHCWFVAEFVRWFKYTCSAHEKTVKALEENEEFWSLTRLEKHYKMSPGKSFFALTRTCACLSFSTSLVLVIQWKSEWIQSWNIATWQKIWLANLQPVFFHTCFLYCLQTIAFYLFSFSNGVSRACLSFCHWGFLSFFLPPPHSCCFFSSQSWRGKRAPATLRPQSHLRQMKQPHSFSSSLHSPLLMTSLCWL